MDQQTPGSGNTPQYSQPATQPQMSPVDEGWAAGVAPVTVAPRSRRMRWTFSAVVVACVVVATAAGAFVLSGAGGSKSLTAGTAPRDSMFFMEVRTDLPGDQHAKLADFMSHFPGFKDRGQFDNALDQMLSKLTGAISPELSYSSAFKPWMEGEVSIAVTAPHATGVSSPANCAVPTAMPSIDPVAMSQMALAAVPDGIAIFALKDRAAAEAWVAGEMTRIKATTTSQTYAGFTVYTVASGYSRAAYAFTDQDLVIGTVGGVQAALDTKTQGSLADVAGYQAAMKSVAGESVARFYYDTSFYVRTYTDSLKQMSCLMTSGTKAIPTLDTRSMPAWLAGSIRAESDRMVVEMTMPNTGILQQGNHTSTLAASLPGSTVGVVEIHGIGNTVTKGLESLTSSGFMDALPGSIKSVKDALDRVGGVDWLGDGAAVLTKNGNAFGGGIVAQATDAATARTKVDLITNLVSLTSGATKATSRDETYKGVGITVISIPASAQTPLVEIAIGAKDNLIVAGYTDSFVKAVIDTTTSDSLASQSDYSNAIGASGNSNMESMYVNVPALEDLMGRTAMSANPARWTQDYKPYFDHIGGVAYSVVDGNTVTMRFVVMAR